MVRGRLPGRPAHNSDGKGRDGGVPSTLHHSVRDEQNDAGPDERHKVTGRVAFAVHARGAANQPSDPRSDEAQNHRQDESHVVTRHHHACQQAYDEPENRVSDHVQHRASPGG